MKIVTKTSLATSLIVLVALGGCSDEDILQAQTGNASPNSGTVSEKNFSWTASDLNPAVYDLTTGTASSADVTITAFIGDRSNQLLTDNHTIFFKTEWGLIEPSCSTSDGTGSCQVTWSARKNPIVDVPDGKVTIIAHTIGEESFIDTNGNGTYDDGETFTDLEEPYIDTDGSGNFSTGDIIIDTVNALDPTGADAAHNGVDTDFNGPGCTHSTDCSTRTTTTVYRQGELNLFSNGFSVGGSVAGLTGGQSLIISLNSGAPTPEAVSVTANGTYGFTTKLANGAVYTLTITGTAGGTTCTFDANATNAFTNTINAADVTDTDITCA